MTMDVAGTGEITLVLAPLGRDAEVACATLGRAGVACRPGRTLDEIDAQPLDRLNALVVTEELLSVSALAALTKRLSAQPSWSSLPVIVLADADARRSGGAHGALVDAFGALTGVILLVRPLDTASFVSVLRSAVLTRGRQLELRDQLRARERAETRAQMLADEMKHRVKNVLTLAGSIASQTFRGAETLDGALQAYSARLRAMSRAQDLLTSSGEDSADFRELVDQALRPYRSGGDWAPFEVDGPALPIAARMATAFSMALHELATNATKYGALSTPAGRVSIRWWHEEAPSGARLLHVRWQERDGPTVVAPERRGFGSRLVERALAYDLGGTARIDFEPGGIVCLICANLGKVGAGA